MDQHLTMDQHRTTDEHLAAEMKSTRQRSLGLVAPVIETLESESWPEWQAFANQAPGCTPFHEIGWMRAVKATYGHKPFYLLARRGAGGAICGVLPLFLVKGPFTGRALITVPYGVYGGAVGNSPDVVNTLLDAAREQATTLDVNYLEIRQGQELPGFQNRSHYYTFRKELPDDPDQLLPSLPKKARAAVRKAANDYHLESRFGHDLIDMFYRLYTVSLRRLASPPHSKRFFEHLIEEYGRRCLVQVVFHERRPVAGVLSLRFRDAMLPYFAGIDARYSGTNASNFLYFKLMERAIEYRATTFDFGRTRKDNFGGCKFKQHHGFVPEDLSYAYFSPEGAEPPDLRPSNQKFSLARKVWRRLPLCVVSQAGGVVTRWIP